MANSAHLMMSTVRERKMTGTAMTRTRTMPTVRTVTGEMLAPTPPEAMDYFMLRSVECAGKGSMR
jgi:hypothetical protein